MLATAGPDGRWPHRFGEARVLPSDHLERDHYRAAFRWENEHAERGRSLAEPPLDTLVVIEPNRIDTEHWLAGYRTPSVAAGQMIIA